MRVTVGNRILVAKTCIVCGELRDGRLFSKSSHARGRSSDCNLCKTARVNAWKKRVSAKSMETATRHKTEWTDRELCELQEFVNAEMGVIDIALYFGRTVNSIYKVQQIYRIRKKTYYAKPGAPIDMSYVRELLEVS